ncbi:MAG: ATP-binding protein [Caulobacter sp.]|nr:ATP-binding protein [Caulobacter sp.]
MPSWTDALAFVVGNHSLQTTLSGIVHCVERELPDTLVSILLLDRTGKILTVGSAPNLPADYNAAVEGVVIGPNVGSCGTAAFLNQTVIVDDIQADPLWIEFRDLAQRAGLRSCWSEPVRDARGKVLGTFALYHRTVKIPADWEIKSLANAAHLVALALERKTSRSALERSEKRAKRSLASARRAVRDLETERDANREREAFYQKIVEIMPTFLVVKNASDGTFALVNPAAEDALGMNAQTAMGKTVSDIFPGSEAEASDAEDAFVIASRTVSVDLDAPVTVANGERKYYTTKKVAVYSDGKPVYIVTAGEDVTERVNAQKALSAALEAAKNANAAKSQFLANMSHELRTPLNGIIAMADLLLDTQTDARAREMAETIIASGRMLEYVVNDILDVAKIEAGQMKFESEPFDLAPVLSGIADLHAAAAEAKGVKLTLTINAAAAGVYLGDRTRVGQIISNLLSNAVKFTERGEVRLSATVGRGGLRVTVGDTGAGFDRSTANRLFRRFEQADASVNRRHGGTGLGLSICKSFAEKMGGRIRVRSVAGAGSVFVVTLPLPRATAAAVEAPAPAPALPAQDGLDRNLRILFADDHAVNQRVVAMMMAPLGVDLTIVENGQLAVEAAAVAAFDLILMDVQMPVMDGLTATRQIRAMESETGRSRTPIISLTANAMPEDVKRSLDTGADMHLAKPIRPAALIAAIESLTSAGTDAKDVTAAA